MLGFNSRSREGSDYTTKSSDETTGVSIRAPARGATNRNHYPDELYQFQFALPRGERHGVSQGVSGFVQFQFALPRGERLIVGEELFSLPKFQFALPRGERLLAPRMARGQCTFQFALPRGERRRRRAICRHVCRFNSRSREGSDPLDT